MKNESPIRRIPKPVMLLKALLDGIEVIIGDRVYGMSPDNQIIIKGQKLTLGKESSGSEETVWLNTFFDFQAFINLAESMTDLEIVQMNFSKVMLSL